jgi:hypothetical protein
MDVRQSFLGLLACTMLIAPQTPLSPDLADTLFQERLASYVQLRDDLSRFAHLPLEPTDERTMTAHRTRVGAALRIARADVPQGNIFSGVVATAFRRITAVAMESPDIREWVVERAFSAGDVARARVNGPLPLGTEHDMFPTLLWALPPLPSGLAYRVLHYDLLIWDLNADVIVDVLPGTFRVETF